MVEQRRIERGPLELLDTRVGQHRFASRRRSSTLQLDRIMETMLALLKDGGRAS